MRVSTESKYVAMRIAVLWSMVVLGLSGSALEAAPALVLDLVVKGLDKPVALTHAGDGSGRLFITQQEGKVLIYDGQRLLPRPFLDITALVSCCGERGLLSLAFHPHYASTGRLYVNYTNTTGDTVIARYQVSPDASLAESTSGTVLLSMAQPYANHNGGQLQFGPDGYLYVGMGDGGAAGDPHNHAQNLRSLLGKLLRLDIDRGTPYAIPPENPFVGQATARSEIWALGLRNPWRFSFDRLTGDLWIADVGQNQWEEINWQPAGSPGGQNYGWRFMEGRHCYNPPSQCNAGSLVLPIVEYSHAQGCSIIGGYRYRGRQMPAHVGTYFYGDFCSGRLWGTRQAAGAWVSTELLASGLQISSFGEDEPGELYVVHYAAGSGALYRLRQPTTTP